MRMGVSSAARSENHVWRDFSSDFLGNLLDVHISTEILSTKLTYFKKMEVFRRHHIPNHQLKLVREENVGGDKTPLYALTKRASGDDSKLQVFRSDIGKIGDHGRN